MGLFDYGTLTQERQAEAAKIPADESFAVTDPGIGRAVCIL